MMLSNRVPLVGLTNDLVRQRLSPCGARLSEQNFQERALAFARRVQPTSGRTQHRPGACSEAQDAPADRPSQMGQ